MNKKVNRSNVWYLLPKQAIKDKNLTTSDKNVLSVLIYIGQAFTDKNGKFFRQRSKLLEDIKESDFELSDKQITRCLVKLQHFGYIKYKAGFHNNKTGRGSASEFELTYNADNQQECQNNVHPNTNTNSNTNTNTNSNINTNNKTKESISTYNKTKENKSKNHTYNISTPIDDDESWLLPTTDDVIRKIVGDIKAGKIQTKDQLNIRCRLDGVGGMDKDLAYLLPTA